VPAKRILDDWLESFLTYTEMVNNEPPKNYRLWTGIATLAGAMQRECFFEFNPMFKIYPNFYIVLVGDSGRTRKSTALDYGDHFLRTIGVPLAPASLTKERLVEKLDEVGKFQPEGEGDDLILLPHNSLTGFFSEIALFIRFDDPHMLTLLTDVFDCKPDWEWETKTAGKYHIPGAFLNFVGGITPKTLNEIFPQLSIDIGLSSRMMFIYEHKGNVVSNPRESKQAALLREQLTTDLEAIFTQTGEFHRSNTNQKLYENWYEEQRKHPPKILTQTKYFDGYLGRRQLHLFKLMMVLSMSRSSEMNLREQDFHRALEILELAEIKMPFTFQTYDETPRAKAIVDLKRYIEENSGLTMEELYSKFYLKISRLDFKECIQALRASKLVRVVSQEGRDSRHTKLIYVGDKE